MVGINERIKTRAKVSRKGVIIDFIFSSFFSFHSLAPPQSTSNPSAELRNFLYKPTQSQTWTKQTTMDKDNANPAILNPSDLPSRRGASQQSTARAGLFDGLIPSYPHYDNLITSTSSFPAPIPSNSSDDSISDDDDLREEIDEQEIFDLISTISDPEHPLSLGSLAVVSLPDIFILPPASPTSKISTVKVLVTPTITHCSLATVIGLGVRVRLEQSLPPRFRVDVRIKEGTHASDEATNKQLGDKERVAAAMENGTLVGVIKKMLSTCE